MAELDVQPKQGTPWWLWLLIALGVLALLFFLMRGCNDDRTDTAATTTETTTGRANTTVGRTWDNVNFAAPAATYDEVSDQNVQVREDADYAYYSLDETVLFDLDQSNIRSGAEQTLQQVAQSAANRYPNAEIRVYGHTDSQGSAAYNQQLGRERAESVRNWLVQNGNIQEDRISVESEGQSEPVAPNTTAEGRQQNRRVEIVARRN